MNFKKDPIELQCLTEQAHAIISIITDAAELNDAVDIDNDASLVIYRIFHYTHWLKETCFDIPRTPDKSTVDGILAALEYVEGLTHLCLWQTQEKLDKHIEKSLEAVANMASESHAETIRLWG